jgi:protein phosphatase
MLGKMDCAGATDVGRARRHNEDQFLIADLNKSMRVHQTSLGLDHQTRLFGHSQGKLLLVADGLGGHASGERASTIAVDRITTYVLNTLTWFFRLDAHTEHEFLDELGEALRECQREIAREAAVRPQQKGMGTTLTMAYLIWPTMYIVHVGDSRCYLHRDGQIARLTTDHTVAEQLISRGALGRSEAEHSRWSDVLLNVIGGDSDSLVPEVHKVQLRLGDAVLLCTDGLTKHVEENEIAEALGHSRRSAEIVVGLIDRANALGGSDNVTVIVARFVDEQQTNTSTAVVEVEEPIEDTAILAEGVPAADAAADEPEADAVSAAG